MNKQTKTLIKQSAVSHNFFTVLSNSVVKTIGVLTNAIQLIFIEAGIQTFKIRIKA